MAGLSSKRDFRERSFGLSEGYNDPAANPWSQAALLQHQHDVGTRGTMNSAGLNLYSGSTVNGLASNDRQYAMGLGQLKQQQEEEQAAWAREEQELAQERQTAREEASGGAVERAAETEPEPMPATGGGGAGAKRHKKRKKR